MDAAPTLSFDKFHSMSKLAVLVGGPYAGRILRVPKTQSTELRVAMQIVSTTLHQAYGVLYAVYKEQADGTHWRFDRNETL